MKLSSTHLTTVRGVCEHIIHMRDIATQLKKLGIGTSKLSLCASFWTLFLSNKTLLRSLIMWRKNKRIETSQTSTSKVNQKGKGRIQPQVIIKKENKCFFCRKDPQRKILLNSRSGLRKKGYLSFFTYYESNMVNINLNTWWIDSSSIIHIENSL